MDKRIQEADVSEALMRIAEERDSSLGESRSIPARRLQTLGNILADAFPIEPALKRTSEARDQLLAPSQLTIPERVRQSLRRSISTGTRGAEPWSFDWRSYASRCVFLQWPKLAAVLAAGIMIAATIAEFTHPKSPFPIKSITDGRRHSSSPLIEESATQSDPRFANAAVAAELQGSAVARNQLSLRVNEAELASLRAPFLALSRAYSAETIDKASVVSLDLPLRSLLLSDAIARTP